MLGRFAYLVTTVLFAGGAVAIEWLFKGRYLWAHRKLLSAITLPLTLLGTLADAAGLRWGSWMFNPDRTLSIFFLGDTVETYLYTFLVVLAIAGATLVWADWEERGLPLIKTTWERLAAKLSRNQER